MDGKRAGMNVPPVRAWAFKSEGRVDSYAEASRGKVKHIGIYIQQALEYLKGNNQVSPSSQPLKRKVVTLHGENGKDCLSSVTLVYPQMGAIAHRSDLPFSRREEMNVLFPLE